LAAYTLAQASSALGDAGDWAAIAAAVFSGLILLARIIAWAQDAGIDHGLHITDPSIFIDGGEVVIGYSVRNGSDVPIRFQTDFFNVEIAGRAHPDTRVVEIEQIAPGQTKGWLREPISHRLTGLQVKIEVTYRVLYGPRRGPMRRALVGGYETTIPKVGNQTVWREAKPAHEERLPRLKRPAWLKRPEWLRLPKLPLFGPAGGGPKE
jgi:hypothetical protein